MGKRYKQKQNYRGDFGRKGLHWDLCFGWFEVIACLNFVFDGEKVQFRVLTMAFLRLIAALLIEKMLK